MFNDTLIVHTVHNLLTEKIISSSVKFKLMCSANILTTHILCQLCLHKFIYTPVADN